MQTYYKHVGDGDVDSAVWPDSGAVDADGNHLYYFSGDGDNQTNGVSDNWAVSTPAPEAPVEEPVSDTPDPVATEPLGNDSDEPVFMIGDDGRPFEVDPNTPAS